MIRSTALLSLLLYICFASGAAALAIAGPTTEEEKGNEESAMNQPSRPIVLLGASYAAGLKTETLAGAPLINKGIGGQQSFEMLARFDDDVVSLEPSTVILWGFINDIFRSERSGIETTIRQTKDNFLEMIARARLHNIQPVLATEVTMSQRPGLKASLLAFLGGIVGKPSYQDYINSHVITVNEWLKEIAADRDLVLLDLQSLLADGTIMRKKQYAQDDGSHLTEAAYRVIAEHMEAELKERP